MNIREIISNFINKVKEEKHPFSRENAYVLSTLNKVGTYEDVRNHYFNEVLDSIKVSAKYGEVYKFIIYPEEITPSIKSELVVFLIKLGYTIIYHNQDIILISWKYKEGD